MGYGTRLCHGRARSTIAVLVLDGTFASAELGGGTGRFTNKLI